MNHFKSDYPLETFSQQQEIKILLLELQVTSWETQIDDGALKYRRSFMVKRHKELKMYFIRQQFIFSSLQNKLTK